MTSDSERLRESLRRWTLVLGVLQVTVGCVVGLVPPAAVAWFATLQLGTWSNGASGLAAAVIGTSSPFMPTINEKFPPPHPADNVVVSGLLMLCAVAILAALLLTLYGLLRRGPPDVRDPA